MQTLRANICREVNRIIRSRSLPSAVTASCNTTIRSAHVIPEVTQLSEKKLDGRVAIITGGANGIGASCARLFHEQGARVFIADMDQEAGETLRQELGDHAHFFPCDVTRERDIAGVVAQAMERYGHLDILHNNVGISGKVTAIQDVDMEEFDRVYAVNIRSIVLGLKYASRVMILQGSGSILSTCSVAGLIGGAAPSSYSFTKGAVPGITRQAAADLGKYGIRVNCISPSGVPTQTQLKGVRKVQGCENLTFEEYSSMMDQISELKGAKLRAETVARGALYLVSDDASSTTGHNLVIDGGFTGSKAYPLGALIQSFSVRNDASSSPSNLCAVGM